MFFGFLWFVIIMIIVVRFVNAAKANDQRPGTTRPPQARGQGRAVTQQGKWTTPQPAPQQKGGGYRQAARPNDRRYAQPARPVQSASYPAKKQNKTENTILQKARANASEQFDGDTLAARGPAKPGHVPQGDEIMRDKAFDRHIHSVHGDSHDTELRNLPGVDDFDTYHLVDEVNDLIVKGYSGSMEFERDFLAEGMDMLNRITM